MRSIIKVISALILFQSGVYAGGLGDFCTDPINAIVGLNSFDTTNNTPTLPEPDESQCPGTYLNWTSSPDVWFKFVPTDSGVHNFTTCDATSFDTSMVLYESSCTLQVACNGDAPTESGCQPYHSALEYSLTAQVPYYIRIGGFNGTTGPGILTIDPPAGSGVNIWYVDIDNPSPGSGSDWSSAFNTLQDALNIATGNDQIWIAEGLYIPTDTNGTTDLREASFRLRSNIELYGGFQGNENSLSDRLPYIYRVFLSGDLNGDDDTGGDNSENAYHVVQADGAIANAPILDGLIIVSGHANSGAVNNYGAGLLVWNYPAGISSFPFVHYCAFKSNVASIGGAVAVYSATDGVSLDRTVFSSNTALTYGGALYNNGLTSITNSLIVGNSAHDAAAFMSDGNSQSTLINTTITQNEADFGGGLILTGGTATCFNSIFWGNTDVNGENSQIIVQSGSWLGRYNCVENLPDTLDDLGNITLNPLFMNEFGADGQARTGDENFQLLPLSPCIDVADNAVVTTLLGLGGNDRILDDPYTADGSGAVVDMGAYELAFDSNNIYIWNGPSSGGVLENPQNWLPFWKQTTWSNLLFNSIDPMPTQLLDQLAINKLVVSAGNVEIDLVGSLFQLDATSNPIVVGGTDQPSTLRFHGGGTVQTAADVTLFQGEITFEDNIALYAPKIILLDNSYLGFDGVSTSDLINLGGKLEPSGRGVGEFTLNGDLINMEKRNPTGNLVGSIGFDIQGTSQGVDYDALIVFGAADMACSIDLKWGGDYTASAGDTFDLVVADTSSGSPSLVYSSGLPSNLAIRWANPSAFHAGGGVIVETTGPILFGAENAQDLASSIIPTDMVVADLNGDSNPDIAMTVQNIGGANGSVVILINNGMSGNTWLGFTEGTPISVGIDPMDIEIGDFNSDGSTNDLVIANNGSNTVSILSNDNSGIFTKTDVSTDIGPMHIAVGDYVEEIGLTRDDIFVACSSFNGSVLTNSSSFRSRTINFSHTSSISIPLAGDIEPSDVNHDKDLDFVILDSPSEEVRVLRGTGAGSTPPMSVIGNPLPSSSEPVELHFADLDFDGFPDAITVNEGSDSLSVLLGSGTELGNASTFVVGSSPSSLVAHDFDNDGDTDLVVSAIGVLSSNRELTVIRNDTPSAGETIILSEGDTAGSGSSPTLVEHGDFDGDGLEDLASIIDQGVDGPGVGIYFNSTAVVVNCPEDIDGDGSIAVGDLLAIISAWGTNDPSADVNNDGVVDVSDLLTVVASWGPCP
ncbi:MAG: hypothetical protein HOI88_04870 [Phycisphaerae bacterium]|nr:hypothetical protein [Phycisphaerae bacterium]